MMAERRAALRGLCLGFLTAVSLIFAESILAGTFSMTLPDVSLITNAGRVVSFGRCDEAKSGMVMMTAITRITLIMQKILSWQ